MHRPNQTNRTHHHESEDPSRAHQPPLTAARLAELLPDGAEPLDDERQCLCDHLEADHRLDGRCSRCMGCRGFAALDEVEDPTAVLVDEGGSR